ncbi:MAG: hypothetical protein OXC07_00355 [Kistimonas sp.]|nr:hypothetical protein [Kistimonas sp.]
MQSLPCPTSSSTGPSRPLIELALPESVRQVLVTLKGRHWYVNPLAAKLVQPCVICQDHQASRHVCFDRRHCICQACKHSMLLANEGQSRCPLNCASVLGEDLLHQLDAGDEQLRADVQVRCAECNNWSGAPDAIDTHIDTCGTRQHPCPRSDYGCSWSGLLEDSAFHETRCDWWPQPCVYPGCQELPPRCQSEQHQLSCRYRPATVGILETTRETAVRLEGLHRFFQQNSAHLAELEPAELRTQLQEAAQLFPLLYETVRCAPPAPAPVMACPWECGFRGDPDQIERHYSHCPDLPLDCTYCMDTVPRRQWGNHLHSCSYRIVPCPRGCDQPGVRARDLATGIHERSCTETPVPCQHCQLNIPWSQMAAHRRSCINRPLRCRWCLMGHSYDQFMTTSASCRRALTAGLVFDGEPLMPHAQAAGPVYVRPGRGDDLVYIRLPCAALLVELGPRPIRGNITRPLQFVWAGMNCRLNLVFNQTQRCFDIALIRLEGQVSEGQTARAALYREDGTLVQQLGADNQDESNRFIMLDGPQAGLARITNINPVATSGDIAFFLQLGPLSGP